MARSYDDITKDRSNVDRAYDNPQHVITLASYERDYDVLVECGFGLDPDLVSRSVKYVARAAHR